MCSSPILIFLTLSFTHLPYIFFISLGPSPPALPHGPLPPPAPPHGALPTLLLRPPHGARPLHSPLLCGPRRAALPLPPSPPPPAPAAARGASAPDPVLARPLKLGRRSWRPDPAPAWADSAVEWGRGGGPEWDTAAARSGSSGGAAAARRGSCGAAERGQRGAAAAGAASSRRARRRRERRVRWQRERRDSARCRANRTPRGAVPVPSPPHVSQLPLTSPPLSSPRR